MRRREPPAEGLPDDPFAGEQFIRVVGKRKRPSVGAPPTPEARRDMDALQGAGMSAPKGVFRYGSHEDANRDREKWLSESMARRRS